LGGGDGKRGCSTFKFGTLHFALCLAEKNINRHIAHNLHPRKRQEEDRGEGGGPGWNRAAGRRCGFDPTKRHGPPRRWGASRLLFKLGGGGVPTGRSGPRGITDLNKNPGRGMTEIRPLAAGDPLEDLARVPRGRGREAVCVNPPTYLVCTALSPRYALSIMRKTVLPGHLLCVSRHKARAHRCGRGPPGPGSA